jgi:hypothetical protein
MMKSNIPAIYAKTKGLQRGASETNQNVGGDVKPEVLKDSR